MTNHFKYLPVSDEDVNWGLHVLNAGYNRIDTAVSYPPPGHPSGHYFHWDKGRVLDEYQIIYISRGAGTFESASHKKVQVREGSVMLLFPQEWHRFRPDPDTGWDEFWVGFKGNIVQNIVQNHFLTPRQSVLQIGIHDHLINLFSAIIEHTKIEQPGYQQLISGMILHLLGEIYAKSKQEAVKHKDISAILINRSMVLLRSYVDRNVSMALVAGELQVSYSWFRKAFKTFTGIAPHQYLLQLKIEKARILLSDPAKSVKEIAFALGFESSFYFSKIFKIKTGYSPDTYRKRLQQ